MIQTISAVDRDLPPVTHRFFFKSPKELRNRNFTIRDFGSKEEEQRERKQRKSEIMFENRRMKLLM